MNDYMNFEQRFFLLQFIIVGILKYNQNILSYECMRRVHNNINFEIQLPPIFDSLELITSRIFILRKKKT
jgi:hypothetical protein